MRYAIRIMVGLLAMSGLMVPQAASAAGFAPGNLVVVRVGTGSGSLSSAATQVFLDEYNPSGSLVQSVPLPVAGSGGQRRLTMSGSATSEGALALSADGRYLTLAGYDADLGTAAVAGTSTSVVPRVVGRIDGNGVVDTTTAITDIFSGANVRGATTDDGSRFWVAGASGGVRLSTLGSTGATTQINSTAPTNLRTVSIAAGQLYFSTGSTPTGVYAVGAGLPTTGGQTPALVTGAPSPYGFVLLDRDPAVSGVDSLYIADDSGSPNGGVLKFSFDGTNWTARGAIRPNSAGVRGLTGTVTGSSVTLFATTATSQLVRVEDTAAFDAPLAATASTLATAVANTALRGLAFAPAGTSNTPTITGQPQDSSVLSGGTATLSVSAQNAESYQWYTGETPIEGATSTSYTTPPLTATTSYWVRVSNAFGHTDSRVATVTVTTAPSCDDPIVTIGSVQGAGDISPVNGQAVTIRGTVVGDYEGASPALRGFYLQDSGDGNASTSDGIFVFDGGSNLVALGDVVGVNGTVAEFQGQTQLTGTVTPCGTQATVDPTDVTLPQSTLEPYEGMLIRMRQTLTVTEHFQLGRFGQVTVSSGAPLRQPTADIRATDTAAVAAAQAANNRNRVIIDDALQNQNADPILFGRGGQPLSASNTLRGGDTATDPVGVMTYTWAGNAASPNAYRLRPLGAMGGTVLFEAANPRPDAPPSVGSGQIKVAAANLLNFFNTFAGCREGCRGAENDTEYQRQLVKEIASLRFLDADVIGYMEMENDGYGPSSAVQALVDALNAVDGPGTWAFVDADAETGVVDVAGLDAIRAGLIYRTASVQPVAGATFVDQDSIFERRPVGQTFRDNTGARFTVIANHFKSKGSCPDSGPDADQGDGQSCWNARRTLQAQELVRWIDETVVPGAGDPDVMIVGDLNSYAGEDPIAVIQDAGYVNLVKRFSGERLRSPSGVRSDDSAYSYVFDGQWGYLDYAMASPSLNLQVTGAGDAHINADEPAILDYNTNFKSPGQLTSLYAPDRFRNSDHDPVLVGLDLGTAATISGTPAAGRVGDPYAFAFTVGGTGIATVTSEGTLPPGITLAADGTLSGTPTKAGTFAFTVTATNLYGSATLDASVSVAKGSSAVTLAAAPNPVKTGDPVMLTATVSAAIAPQGTVSFGSLGSAPLVGGVATLTVTLAAGTHSIVASYEGSDDLTPSTSDVLSVAVIDPVELGGTLPAGTVGSAYEAQIQFTGGQPVSFSVTGGALPAGLTLSSAGVVSGTPTTGGTFAVTVTAVNPVSTTSGEYVITIGKAATSTTVVSSANPSTVGGAVRFTATVNGPLTPNGTVQFTVDGQPLGGPVTLVNGVAVSSPIQTLATGSHQVTAVYAGSASYEASTGSLVQVVRYGIKVIKPVAGSSYRAGAIVPVTFQVIDANGNPISLTESVFLALSGRVTVSASGAQTLTPTPVLYDPFGKTFLLPWLTRPRQTGAVTVTISITYPGASTQQVNIPITLT